MKFRHWITRKSIASGSHNPSLQRYSRHSNAAKFLHKTPKFVRRRVQTIGVERSPTTERANGLSTVLSEVAGVQYGSRQGTQLKALRRDAIERTVPARGKPSAPSSMAPRNCMNFGRDVKISNSRREPTEGGQWSNRGTGSNRSSDCMALNGAEARQSYRGHYPEWELSGHV